MTTSSTSLTPRLIQKLPHPPRPSRAASMPISPLNSTSTSASSGGGSGLLLRLFQSEYFNVHLAISYLKNYPDSIGITYYLIDRLDHFPEKDIEFYWPQLCHLLISRPTESFALESFLIKKCHESTHLAMKTLWYLQSSLSDLSSSPTTRSFAICRRTFNKVQSIIFCDPLMDLLAQQRQEDPRISAIRTAAPNGSVDLRPGPSDPHQSKIPNGYFRQLRKQAMNELAKLKGGKISEKVMPTAVGIGLVLGGIGLPDMTNRLGTVPIEQSRSYEDVLNVPKLAKNPHSTEPNNSASEEEPDELRKPIPGVSSARITSGSESKNVKPSSSSLPTSVVPRDIKGKSKMKPDAHNKLDQASPRNHPPPVSAQSSRSRLADYSAGVPLTTHTPMSLSISDSESSLTTPSSIALTPESQANQLPSRQSSSRNSSQDAYDLASPRSEPHNLIAPFVRSGTILHQSVGLSSGGHGSSETSFALDFSKASLNRNMNASTPPNADTQSSRQPLPPISSTSARTRAIPAVSQSVPSLPNALAKSKHVEPPPGSFLANFPSHRYGPRLLEARDQSSAGNPLLSPSIPTSLNPSAIPTHVFSQVLKSQSMRSQLDLITNLQDISTRLVIVPKMARLSALRAELTVLNHSLPKGCCLGMYCRGDHVDGPDEEGPKRVQPDRDSSVGPPTHPGETRARRAHHRIVRISPNESVVLNSADRAPFLIHVEVLEDHLDFNPNRRSNYEDMRKALSNSALSTHVTAPSRRQQNMSAGNSDVFLSVRSTDPHTPHGSESGRPLSPGSASFRASSDHSSIHARSPLDHVKLGNPVDSLIPSGQSSTLNTSVLSEDPGSANFSSAGLTPVASTSGNQIIITTSQHSYLTDSPPAETAAGQGLVQLPIDEEVDLVEQVYGHSEDSRLSSKAIFENSQELLLSSIQSERNYLPSGLQNKALDEEAWKRVKAERRKSLGSPVPAQATSPDQEQTPRLSPLSPSPGSSRRPSFKGTKSLLNGIAGSTSQLLNSTALTKSNQKPIRSTNNQTTRKPVTLDEYAERMRMAAIMLAQLNASQLPSQQLSMTSSSAAGMVVGGAIGLGAGFVGVTVGAGLGAVVSRLATNNSQPILTSPIGRRTGLPNTANASAGQGGSGLTTKLDTTHAASGSKDAPRPDGDVQETDTQAPPSTSNMNSGVPRHKVLTPVQSQAIKDRIMAEMMALEEERVERMRLDTVARTGGGLKDKRASFGFVEADGHRTAADEAVVMKAVNEEDPSGSMLGESWSEKRKRIQSSSPYGHLSNWNVFSVIVKTGADLRQEQLITQLIKEFGRIWKEEACDVWVRYYRILVTGESTGLMETIVDAVSLHSLKKAAYAKMSPQNGEALPNYTIYDHYLDAFGEPHTTPFKNAQDRFMRSLVAYSIISYILQLKDRHNGNILIDKDGHVIHIDFGFVLSNSPGSLGFEMAPFKLSQDYIELLGGLNQSKWIEFIELFKLAFKKVRKHAERIITIVELMQSDSRLPCFGGHGDSTVKNLRDRFQLGLTSGQCDEFVEKLIVSSASSVFTKLYDSFQYYSQGVL